jgi:GTPase SAR1 family protein
MAKTEQSKLRLWDLGGRRDIRQLWAHYYTAAHAVIYVVRVRELKERMAEVCSCLGR